METIPLEDNYTDVVGKAQRGLRLGDKELADRAGIQESQLAHFKGGAFDPEIARRVARPLALHEESLVELGSSAGTRNKSKSRAW